MNTPDKYSIALDELCDELNNVDVTNMEFAPYKKRDANDHYLGTLPIRLQKLWVIKQKTQCKLDDAIQKIADVIECLKGDIADFEGKLPEWKSSEYSLKLKDLVVPIKPLVKKWKAHEDILNSFIRLLFDNGPDMPIFVIRSGYKVCCRKDNSRNDIYNPLTPIVSAFGLGEFLKVHQEVIHVEFPKNLDMSKLSPKEILAHILRHMK